MTLPVHGGGRRQLQVEEDLALQRTTWRMARVSWVILVALIAATLLGIFGNGPLSRATTRDGSGALEVEYQRMLRFGDASELVVHARVPPDGRARISVGRGLLDAFRVTHVTPAPSATVVGDTGVEYRFDGWPARMAVVVFTLQPTRRWRVRGSIRSREGSGVELRQFVFP